MEQKPQLIWERTFYAESCICYQAMLPGGGSYRIHGNAPSDKGWYTNVASLAGTVRSTLTNPRFYTAEEAMAFCQDHLETGCVTCSVFKLPA